ncbi:Lrp/AsnC family transcriptional regulator [Listeria seeligeri]|uniref:Lrp/AsnC family transcriptional regulator n=2 Tax=Listeria seeligeri TaxID=1640 RepID=UPI00162743F6|nr:AsnC family transcriptional regulator [Listeria seeligeri]MBC1424373.1 AsnC family transcriptional regulator [Listeria seeligeri]MBC1480301.1 AsnC family transcriptional regulator [Listeria seeligeri]MBC1533476.1 AsnC family transcriptional regulator [Listeria seeligeri]MBC1720701.1 AsnC family transcriptional regulator [Listeria seeligeri]MBC1727980.1 AsnC family transcriptional regulator [Listeria seeligeri]
MDSMDKKIIEILQENSRLTNKEIGVMIHLTGQAVGNRIIKLVENGIIRKFSVEIEYPKTQFIRVFMDRNNFSDFEQFVNSCEAVSSIYKVSGQACYMVIGHFLDDSLNEFIQEISKYGRYSVEAVVADKTSRNNMI